MITRNVVETFERTSTSVRTYKIDLAPLTNSREGAVSDYLPSGVTISSAVVTASSDDVTVDSSSVTDTNTSITITVSGGSATVGASTYIDAHVVLSDGDEDDFSIKLLQVARKSI